MSFIRIRVQFEKTIPLRPPYNDHNHSIENGHLQQCFITSINTLDYSNLADLQIFLLKKFARKDYRPKTAVRIYIGDALAGSHESISILRDDDCIQLLGSKTLNMIGKTGNISSLKLQGRSEDSVSDCDIDNDRNSNEDRKKRVNTPATILKTPSSSDAKAKISMTSKGEIINQQILSSPSPDAKMVWNLLRERQTFESQVADSGGYRHSNSVQNEDVDTFKTKSSGKKKRKRSGVALPRELEGNKCLDGNDVTKLGHANRANMVFVSAAWEKNPIQPLPPPLPPLPPPLSPKSMSTFSSSYDMCPSIRIEEGIVGRTVAFTRCYLKGGEPKTSGYIVGKILKLEIDSMRFHVDVCYERTYDAEFSEQSARFTREENEMNGISVFEFDINDRPKCYVFDCREVITMRLIENVESHYEIGNQGNKEKVDGDESVTQQHGQSLPEDLKDMLAQRKRELLASL